MGGSCQVHDGSCCSIHSALSCPKDLEANEQPVGAMPKIGPNQAKPQVKKVDSLQIRLQSPSLGLDFQRAAVRLAMEERRRAGPEAWR